MMKKIIPSILKIMLPFDGLNVSGNTFKFRISTTIANIGRLYAPSIMD